MEEISVAFTKDRSKIGRYLEDPRLVAAYTAFYLTTNVPKLEAVLSWLTPEARAALKEVQLIDVGAGPGTFSLAWRSLMGGKSIQIETSRLMREQSQKLFKGLYNEEAEFDVRKAQAQKLALFGHSMNEMGVSAVLKYIDEIKPQEVWFIEPGTKQVFEAMLDLREKMLQGGWSIRFPCLGHGACPMKGTDDWCHQYVSVRHDVEVERLTQMAHKDRREMPLCVFMFERQPIPERVGSLARLVRVFPETKFSHEWQGCDREQNLVRFELPFKSYPKDWRKSVEALKAGDLIQYEVDKTLEGKLRVKLVKE